MVHDRNANDPVPGITPLQGFLLGIGMLAVAVIVIGIVAFTVSWQRHAANRFTSYVEKNVTYRLTPTGP